MRKPTKQNGFSSPTTRVSSHRATVAEWKQNKLLPALPPDEYATLKESIRVHGLRVPIIVDQHGKTVDGWHRQRACDELGMFCPREVRHFESNAERLQVTIALNANRRHLTRNQRRELIAVYLKADPRINDNHLGEIVGVSKNTVAAVRGELESTRQIDKLPVRRGRDGKDRPATYRRIIASTPKETEKALAAINDLPPTKKIMDAVTASRHARRHSRKQEIAARPIVPLTDDSVRLFHCPFQELESVAGLAAFSVNLICTDIPYIKEFVPEITALGEMAERILVPGGLFVTYSGTFWLDKVIAGLGQHLIYCWTMASTWTGVGTPAYPLNLVSHWLPILVFSKGDWQRRGMWHDWLHDSGKEKDWHEWQRPLLEVEKLIRYFSEPGDLVVDACGGGFTTAVACRNLGRRFIGCDVDEQCVSRGWERLAKSQSEVTQ